MTQSNYHLLVINIKRWIPVSAKFCLIGDTPKTKGICQIVKLNKNKLDVVKEVHFPRGLKCCTFGASKHNPL